MGLLFSNCYIFDNCLYKDENIIFAEKILKLYKKIEYNNNIDIKIKIKTLNLLSGIYDNLICSMNTNHNKFIYKDIESLNKQTKIILYIINLKKSMNLSKFTT
jgi:hypothetical protein